MNPFRAFRNPITLHACRIAIFALLGAGGEANAQAPAIPPNRFEKNMQAYEAADKAVRPPPGAILLVGDSQFFRWKTVQEDLAGYTVVNRGIDSFQFSDLLHFTDRLVLPYQPRLIVLHVGGNDVHTGETPDRLLTDFKTFVQKVRAVFPQLPIAFTSITPSPDAGRKPRCAGRPTRPSATTSPRKKISISLIFGTPC